MLIDYLPKLERGFMRIVSIVVVATKGENKGCLCLFQFTNAFNVTQNKAENIVYWLKNHFTHDYLSIFPKFKLNREREVQLHIYTYIYICAQR